MNYRKRSNNIPAYLSASRSPLWIAVGALLIVGHASLNGASDDEVAFPSHGACTYLDDSGGISLSVYSYADDHAAARMRTQTTNRVLAMIPQLAPRRVARRVDPPMVGSGACNGIDACIEAAASRARVPLAGLSTDLEFLRRARLELTGRIPTADEVYAFLQDSSPNKREVLVQTLIDSPEWADRWTMFFGDMFEVAESYLFQMTRDSFHYYLLNSLRENKPYDQMVREMLAAEGISDGRTYLPPKEYRDYDHYMQVLNDLKANPMRPSPLAYIVGGKMPGGPMQDTYDRMASRFSLHFLGISSMECILCHDGEGRLDSLSIWGTQAKRLEGWQLAAFFSRIPYASGWRLRRTVLPRRKGAKRPKKPRHRTIFDLPEGEFHVNPGGSASGRYVAATSGGNRPARDFSQDFVEPKYPFSTSSPSKGSRDRERLGWYLTGDPQFARATVNYIWKEFFSRGIVEPADGFDIARLDPAAPPPEGWSIQPSHPALLEWLAQEFIKSGFDLKWLMTEITTSLAYQRSARYEGAFSPNYERYFVRYQAKRLTAEQVHDAVSIASGMLPSYRVSSTFKGRARYAMQFPDINLPRGKVRGAKMLLEVFLRGDRQEVKRSDELSPLQALNLMNNPFVLSRVNYKAPKGTLEAAIAMTDDQCIRHVYASVLGRMPTAAEAHLALQQIGRGSDRARQVSDLMWALLNREEFVFNY